MVAAQSQGQKPQRTITSAAHRRFNGGNIDAPHRHHRFEGPLGGGRIGVRDDAGQRHWSDLPRHAPAVLAPAAGALAATIVDDGIPVAIGFSSGS